MQLQLFQFNITRADSSQNEQKITTLFEEHLDDQTDVVVLPEMWNNGYALAQLEQLADENLTQSYAFIQKLAQDYQVDIIAG
ncbi:nitrilase-related carbon-nitrogen hydrolase, partial [Staphylococcus lugdunensis]